MAELRSRGEERESLSAVALVEGAVADRVIVALERVKGAELDLPSTNLFGSRIAVERIDPERDARVSIAERVAKARSRGERVALVTRAEDLPMWRAELARLAHARLGLVVHAIAGGGVGGAEARDPGPVPAVADLPLGVLLAAGTADAVELSFVAHRAAEDASYPFLVVHGGAVRQRNHPEHRERRESREPAEPSREALAAFLGDGRLQAGRGSSDEPHEPHEPHESVGPESGFGERMPFALSSAMREIEAVTGRRRDVVERAPGPDCAMALVGAGAVGDALLAEVSALRSAGHDVGAVRVVAWRPFPAARLVKTLSRALAMTVVEDGDSAAGSSGPLATHLKAAFADALTWAPDFPGIGCIPRIVSGFVPSPSELGPAAVEALVENMLRSELGKRTLVLGRGAGSGGPGR